RLDSYLPAEKRWEIVWFFNLTRYRDWFRSKIAGQVEASAPPPDDEFLRAVRKQILELPTRHASLIASENGYRWAVANSVIRFILGDEWWRRNFIDQTAVIPQANNMRGMLRSIALGELLLNLRGMHGMPSRVEDMRTADLESVLRELDTALLIVR